ncbi:MAG: SPOR domain-containing protein [Paludibacteraceae bacterium]|nr:SPOR domain-containing protein [Paludibacteraceae bacterium]
MKRIRIFIVCVFCCALCIKLSAQDEVQYFEFQEEIVDTLLLPTDTLEIKLSTRDYLNLLMTPDSLTGAVINIYQDSAIYFAIDKKELTEAVEAKGFRIQIYSSNRGAVARERAFEIKDILITKHPQLADEIYITYTSPFWKVRIGNCENNAKAQELRQWIIAEFPEFTTETYIVPSMIYVY